MSIINNSVIEAVLTRQTIREYAPEQISDDMLDTLMRAALLAPSGRNSQPCRAVFCQNRNMLDEINTEFRDLVGWDTPAYTRCEKNPFYHNAPTFVFIFAEGGSYMDGGLMAENICIAAKGLGLGTCIVGSVGALMDAPQGGKWRVKLGVPEDYRFLIGVAVGYPDEKPEPKPREADHVRVIR